MISEESGLFDDALDALHNDDIQIRMESLDGSNHMGSSRQGVGVTVPGSGAMEHEEIKVGDSRKPSRFHPSGFLQRFQIIESLMIRSKQENPVR